jgi:hypothetical protein
MSLSFAELGSLIARYAVRAVGGPRFMARQIFTATLSVAQTLLELVRLEGLASDVRDFKSLLYRKTQAEVVIKESEAASAVAEAQKKLAEAAEEANKANLPKRNDAIALAEQAKARVEVAKAEAEVEAIRMEAEGKRAQAIAEAQAKLIDALSKLRQDGGGLAVDPAQLREMLRLQPPGTPPALQVRVKDVLTFEGKASASTPPGDKFDFAPRICAVLVGAGITTWDSLASKSAVELLSLKGFGEKSLAAVRASLQKRGLSLRGD